VRLHLAAMMVVVMAPAMPLRAQTPALPPLPRPASASDESPAGAGTEDVVVVTASRREQQLDEAPATMTVLTQDVINRAPNLTLTDLLRLVPGVNTVQTSARDVNVTVRAATGTLSDSTLVLLDGRSIYQDFFGFVLWDFLPIDTAEIKQVEVIRGPASAVWGANAMTGVINVISRPPREMQGTTVAIRFGQFDRSPAGGAFDGGGVLTLDAIHAEAPTERFAFKVSVGLLAQEALLRPTGNLPGSEIAFPAFRNRGTAQPKLDGRADYDFADRRQRIVVAAGTSGTQGIVHTGLGPLDIQPRSTFTYGRMTYVRNRLKLQFFVNALDAHAEALLQKGLDGGAVRFAFKDRAYDVDGSDVAVLGNRHLVSYGGNYRHNSFDLSAAARGHRRDEGGAYGQDEIFLSERVRWIVGARLDAVDILHKVVVSPRTTLLLQPRPSQTVRLSYNRAFRAPSFFNSFFDLGFLQEVNLGEAGTFSFPVAAIGNERLREEQLTAYEAAFVGLYGRFTTEAAVYVNRTRNMIQFTQSASYTSDNPPPRWPLPLTELDKFERAGRGIPSRFTYANFDRITDRGVELSVQARLPAGATTFANYSWQGRPRPEGFDIAEINLPPAHRVNLGTALTHGRYFGNASLSYIGPAYWQDVDPRFVGRTASYVVLNAGTGVDSTDRTMTVAVRVNNLLNSATQQHIFGDIIKRTVTGEVRFRF
jgi:outer membrane receptor protein involved in Fe transport